MQVDTFLTQSIAHTDPCGRNIKNNYLKGRTLELEPFHLNVDTQNNSRKAPNQRRSKKTGVGTERDRARRAAETAD